MRSQIDSQLKAEFKPSHTCSAVEASPHVLYSHTGIAGGPACFGQQRWLEEHHNHQDVL